MPDFNFSAIPDELRALPRWVLWGMPGEPPKEPHSPRTGKRAGVASPDKWTNFDAAQAAMQHYGARGLGFMLGAGLACVDFDHCFDPGGDLDPWVASWVNRLGGWAERSQSGTGLHVFVRGALPGGAIKTKQAELYDGSRYIAMTGDVYGPPRALADAQQALDELAHELRSSSPEAPAEAEGEPLNGDTRQSRLEAGLKADRDLQALWTATEHTGDESEQDYALAKSVYRALRPCALDDVATAMDGSPWVESKDGKHARKWQRPDYRQRTAQRAAAGVCADDQEALNGFQGCPEPAGPWAGFFSLADLAGADLPPIRWAVPELLPAGLCLLVAAPKIGKSWAALDLCLAVASGGLWLGKKAEQGDTLYLDLEDSPQRLQSRLRSLSDGFTPTPHGCTVRLNAPALGQGLEKLLSQWADKHPDARLVVIDTFQRVRPPQTGKENAYAADYRACATLQSWAMQRGLCLLLVHHTKKARDPADVFNSISGSTGIFGAADAVLTLTKDRRFDDQAKLSITGRDVDADELAVVFDKDTCRWRVLGKADEVQTANDPVLEGLELLCSVEPWQGTAGQLLDELLTLDPAADLPGTTSALGVRLRRLEPELHRRGIAHSIKRSNNARVHVFSKAPVTPVTPSPEPPKTAQNSHCDE